MKTKINKILSRKAGISYLQIFILITASFAFSYMISETNGEINKKVENQNIEFNGNGDLATNILISLASFFHGWLKRSKLGLVSAQVTLNQTLTEQVVSQQDTNWNCCPETKSGAICQDIASGVCSQQCKQGCIPSKCEQVSSCKLGCCFNQQEGICQPNSPKQTCEIGGGKWKDVSSCNIEECRLGCCILGQDAQFVTEKRCEKLTSLRGLQLDFRGEIVTEIGCLALSKSQAVGACVIETENEEGNIETGCKFLSKPECLQLTGNALSFHENLLCTNQKLNTICKKAGNTTCIEGKDEVYFRDSCGNPANIYDSNKINSQEYWDKFFSKADSCNPGSGNAESKTCGNCNYFLGSKCGEENKKNICKDLNCKNAPYVVDALGKVISNKDRKNGESWCVYDSYVGEGKDVVGSRHWKYYCLDGEVKIEPCSDFRQEICVQSDIESGGETFSQASCRINRWRECIDYNSEAKMAENCKENSDCYIKQINIDKGFKFPVCVPNYPSGFDLKDSLMGETAGEVCGIASQTCTVIYLREVGGWECAANCDCEKAEFTRELNDLCIGLGDCGGYVNIAGKVDNAYGVYRAPKISLERYSQFINPKEGQASELGNLTAYYNAELASRGGNIVLKYKKKPEKPEEYLPFAEMFEATIILKPVGMIFKLLYKIPILGRIIKFILEDIIGGILKALFGWGKTKKIKVIFNCYPWQAPIGGEDCEKCNLEGSLKSCSKYRCESLGQACRLMNEGTPEEKCFWDNKDDVSAPVINPWKEVLSSGYKYEEILDGVKIKTTGGECIQAYTPLLFGITTKEYAQCKFDTENKDYDEMTEYLGIDNLYRFNHTAVFITPSPDAIANELNLSELNMTYQNLLDKIGEMRFYVKCQDANGNQNIKPYLIDICIKPGPDKTPPLIFGANPASGSFIKFNATKQDITLFVNEPAECKWSFADKNYNAMENNMSCETDLENVGLYGWECNTTLDLAGNLSKFYFRCKDQPWLPAENETNRNANEQGFKYELKKSVGELKIDKIEPNQTIIAGVEPVSVTLKALTSGGAEQGKARCDFKFEEEDAWIEFRETYSNEHEQLFDQMLRGTYLIYVRCEDAAGNIAEGQTTFYLELDTTPPRVVRAYNAGGLKIITNEDAECAYDNQNCNFVWENATKMSGIQKEHDAGWEQGRTYYIKCKDLWNNKADGCSIIVRSVDTTA